MSADFWAGYVSGAAGILIGNPLDIVKVRLQNGNHRLWANPMAGQATSYFSATTSLVRGAAAPILGYGALNALLFVTYNRTAATLNGDAVRPELWTTWVAGAIGGLATWLVSTPTELIKCRAQTSNAPAASSTNSWLIGKELLRSEGVKGLYFGGTVTALRDSIGYGFYFWSYELSTRYLEQRLRERGSDSTTRETMKVLLCGGMAGVVTWVSVFPLDVIKTRVQSQVAAFGERSSLIRGDDAGIRGRLGAMEVAKIAYRTEGISVFFRGLGVCSIRAFIVNAAQWAIYEWMMTELNARKPRK